MINKYILKQVLASNQKDIENYKIVPRTLPGDDFPCRVFVGVRRAGKSFMLYQKMQQTLASGQSWATMLYLNFEDDRLAQFDRSDFELILEAHAEMYGQRPMLFLDEIQNIEGWEKFARRLADAKYAVWLTGSNAKMLSSEVMTTLGGRYLATEVYPYSFQELLKIQDIPYDKISQMATESRAKILRAWNEYLLWGGLPESVGLTVKRNYLSSTFQKLYLGDIASRNKIANPNLLRLMVKKLVENVGQPVSYNRSANVLSTISGRISMPTVSISNTARPHGSCCAYEMFLHHSQKKKRPASTTSSTTECLTSFCSMERPCCLKTSLPWRFSISTDMMPTTSEYSSIMTRWRSISTSPKMPLPSRFRIASPSLPLPMSARSMP